MGALKTGHAAHLWVGLVADGVASQSRPLSDDVSSYLAFMLQYYAQHPRSLDQHLGHQFLYLISAPVAQFWQLRAVGDQALLFAGFFPDIQSRFGIQSVFFFGPSRVRIWPCGGALSTVWAAWDGPVVQ